MGICGDGQEGEEWRQHIVKTDDDALDNQDFIPINDGDEVVLLEEDIRQDIPILYIVDVRVTVIYQ